MTNSEIENLLKASLDRYLHQADGMTPPHLEEAIRYSLLSSGKRIRPRLLLACAEMLDLPIQTVAPAALALEMIHCFTLIHDDLPCMDDDDFRRGLPSNHKKFGEATALLAGDALMALAMDVFLESPMESSRLIAGLKRLIWATGPRGVIGGQAAESLLNPDSRLEDLHWMHAQKTGALFSAALLIPKDFAGIPDHHPHGQTILDFASRLGLAFQAADDLEDQPHDPQAKIEPTSILYYLSENEVRKMIIQQLDCNALVQKWGDKTAALKKIIDEITAKAEKARKGNLS